MASLGNLSFIGSMEKERQGKWKVSNLRIEGSEVRGVANFYHEYLHLIHLKNLLKYSKFFTYHIYNFEDSRLSSMKFFRQHKPGFMKNHYSVVPSKKTLQHTTKLYSTILCYLSREPIVAGAALRV